MPNDDFDSIWGKPAFDPSEPPGVPGKTGMPEREFLIETPQKLFKGLGILGWPFQAVSHTVGTVLKDVAERRLEQYDRAKAGGDAYFQSPISKEAIKTVGEIWSSKSPPPESSSISEVYGQGLYPAYYRAVTGEEPPEWLKMTQGAAADFLATPYIAGKVLRGVGGLAKATGIPARIQKARIPAWQAAKSRARANLGARKEVIAEIAKPATKRQLKQIAKELSARTGKKISPDAVAKRLGKVVRGGVTEIKELKRIANPIIADQAATQKALIDAGLLGKETFLTKLTKGQIQTKVVQRNKLSQSLTKMQKRQAFPGQAKKVGDLQKQIKEINTRLLESHHLGGEKYLPRFYKSKEHENLVHRLMGYQSKRIRRQYAKRRGRIPLEVRRAMGEIEQPAYPYMKRAIQSSADLETAKLFKLANRKWASTKWQLGYAQKPLPIGKAYGDLAGKYVPKRIHSDITEMLRVRNQYERLYDSMIGTWKVGKVIWNPATHFRNMFSNSILLDLSGVDHLAQARLAKRAYMEVRSNSAEYQYAKKYFGRTTLAQAELMDDFLAQSRLQDTGLHGIINKVNSAVKKGSSTPAKMYGKEEFSAKFIKYLDMRSKGASRGSAVREANTWLFDYGDLTSFESKYLRRIMPFYTFPRKAIPRVVEAAAKNPYALAKYSMAAWAFQKHSMAQLEITEKDYKQIEKSFPEFMQNDSYLLMPYRDKNNDLRFFDWTYVIPWGPLSELQSRGALDVFVTNPIIQVVGDIQRNKSSFTDREIWKETDTDQEKFLKKLEYFWMTATPSLAPKGLYWDKLEAAITKTPSKYGKVPPLKETIAHTIFGARTQPIDVKQQKIYKVRSVDRKRRELEAKLRDIAIRRKNKNITPEEYDDKKQQYLEQLRGLKEELPNR